MNQKEIKNHMNATNIEELCNEDLIFVNIWKIKESESTFNRR